MRLLTARDIPALMGLRDEVLDGLVHSDLYVRESDECEFVRAHVDSAKGSGETIGIFDGRHLVAYGMLGLPRSGDPDDLGRFFGGGRSDLRAAHLASCMVSPQYRGRHLQRMLLKARVELAWAKGKNFCAAMISMHNHASRRNLMREGLRIGWVAEIDGLKRQLLAVDLAQPLMFDGQRSQVVRHDDWALQQELVRQGWWGIEAQATACPDHPLESVNLVFARLDRPLFRTVSNLS